MSPKSSFVSKGMPVKVAPIGMGDVVLKGTVKKVSQYAEPSGWRKANVKEYMAFVKIDYPPAEIRPGMTAAVTIECLRIPDAMLVPVQAVYAHGQQFFLYGSPGRKMAGERSPLWCDER